MRAALLLLLASSTALANPEAEKLAGEGEELAKTGEYSRAIDKFKAADRLAVKSRHACMIGLAYLRREAWPQAELFFDTCKQRASIEDPLPDWFQDAMAQLKAKLEGTTVSAVTINVTPPGSLAQITASSFAPDEKFAPRTIHLAPGTHTIQIAAPGYPEQSRTFDVKPSEPLVIDIELKHAEKRYMTPPASKVPWFVMGGGALLVVIGGVHSLAVVAPDRSDLEVAARGDITNYQTLRDDFKTTRALNATLYGLGAITIGVGLVLKYTVFEQTPVLVGAEPVAGGGVLTVGWTN